MVFLESHFITTTIQIIVSSSLIATGTYQAFHYQSVHGPGIHDTRESFRQAAYPPLCRFLLSFDHTLAIHLGVGCRSQRLDRGDCAFRCEDSDLDYGPALQGKRESRTGSLNAPMPPACRRMFVSWCFGSGKLAGFVAVESFEDLVLS